MRCKTLLFILSISILFLAIFAVAEETQNGIEIEVQKDSIVHAVQEGKIYKIRNNKTYPLGKSVTLEHKIGDTTFYTFYGNLDEIDSGIINNEGKTVESGKKLGKTQKLFLAIGTSVDSVGRIRKSESYDPLCFFPESELKRKGVQYDRSKLNYESSSCIEAEKVFKIKLTKETKCSDFPQKTLCSKTPNCFWDSKNNKCKECPDKCEGERTNLLDWGTPDLSFQTKDDCQENTCNLKCFWLESDRKCIGYSSLDKEKILQAIFNIIWYGSLSPNELNYLLKVLQEYKEKTSKDDLIYYEQKIKQKLATYQEVNQVFIVSSVNNGLFNDTNKLVGYSDNVKICAVLQTREAKFSTREVATNNNLDIREWKGEQPEFRWYEIVPESKAYDGGKIEREQEIITYIYRPVGNEWCITANSKMGTYFYSVNVTWQDKIYSSPQTYSYGIETFRVSRKSPHPNKFIATIESFKNVPFVGDVLFLSKDSKTYSMTQLYKGMECNTLVSSAVEQVLGTELSWQIHDKIENFIERFGIREYDGQKIEKIRINDLLGMAIPVQVGDIFFLYNENLQPPAYDHTIVIYENKNTLYLEQDDVIVYTSSGCIEGGDERQRDGVIKTEGNLCYATMRRFLARNSPATFVRISQLTS